MGATKTLLILSVSAGAGHMRAAEALKARAEADYPDWKVELWDVMSRVPTIFRKAYTEAYLKLVEQMPEVWGYLYSRSDRPTTPSKLDRFRILLERFNTVDFVQEVRTLAPDAVICTHFLPAMLLARKKGQRKFTTPTHVVVTDFDVHRLWIHDHINGYFAANEEVAYRMACRGILKENITVSGIPIHPVFGTALDKKVCRKELELSATTPTALLMAGGEGVGAVDALAERLGKEFPTLNIIALAGRNAELLKKLQKSAKRFEGRIIPMGFTRTIERCMISADFAVSKPGGLTTSEALALGLPLIVVDPIPGQEERNADALLEAGAGMKACDADALVYRVKKLIADPTLLQTMRKNALKIGKPNAAKTILEKVLSIA